MPKASKPVNSKSKRPSKSNKARSQQKKWVTITLRTDKDAGDPITFQSNEALQQVAMKWRAVVRNRSLWTGSDEKKVGRASLALKDFKDALMQSDENYSEIIALREKLRAWEAGKSEDAKKKVEEKLARLEARIGVEESISKLAEASIIEVSIPFDKENEDVGWEARILPWEYLITAATSSKRSGQPLTIIRHLDCGREHKQKRKPGKLMVIQGASGSFARAGYDLGDEGNLMRRIIDPDVEMQDSDQNENRLPSSIKAKILAERPDIIHLAGMDTHQGIMSKFWTPPGNDSAPDDHSDSDDDGSDEGSLSSRKSVRDGFLMKGEDGHAKEVGPGDLAEILNAGKAGGEAPLLVACNFYHSAARIGPMIVAKGAQAAIGFQDEFDDAMAELFFGNFYHAWRVPNGNLLAAFMVACQKLRAQPRGLSGTGVVLWTAESTLKDLNDEERKHLPLLLDDLDKEMRKDKAKVIKPDDAIWGKDEATARKLLPIEINPSVTVNYSMLHNERPLFKKFMIHKLDLQRVNHVEVDVALQVGDQKAEFSASCDVVDSPLDLRDKIRLPLLSKAWAEIGESARTTLSVRLRWGNHELYRQTHPVTLLTLDEWRDDDVNTAWLPSFVLPRDPMVRRIIESGQKYLMALRDDPVAGFDGYQSLDPKAGDAAEIAEDLDYQVRAIWSAIVYDHSISYTNPPPSFTARSQRLRSPSEIFEAKRATCIDTTLLLAACLELVEIYPVLFLLTGHAFVGYWRSEDYRQEFMERMAEFGSNVKSSVGLASDPYKPTYAWYFENRFYNIILEYIREAKLVPLESTLLTTRGSYGDAITEGLDNLRNRREFHSMMDVVTAREHRVTPIPMRGR